ncbi:YwaF family protein [Paenibacillus sp. CAU 1782]
MFQLFSGAHYAALAATVIVLLAIVVGRRALRSPRADGIFRKGLAALLLLCEISLQLSYVLEGSWGAGSLPFQLCSLTLLLSALLLLTGWKSLFPVIVFLGMLGALQALLTPNLDETFPQFRYFHFFIAHIGIMATAVYAVAVRQYRPTLRSAAAALIWLHILAVPAAIVNMLTGTTNFMFLARKPSTASLLDALAPWPWYLLQLELVAIAMCLLLYGGMVWIDKSVRRRSQ